jgi:ribosomal-protein-alanine N-acetyltransferase
MYLQGNQIYLRYFRDGDEYELVDFHIRNRDYFTQYSASREEQYFTAFYQRQLINMFAEDRLEDSRYCLGVYLKQTHQLIGVISLSDVARGPLQSAYLGYCLDQVHAGKGYTSEAVRLTIAYAFDLLYLHRIEAGIMPANIASQRVLEKNRFENEGLCKKNIKINGQWEDHYLFARINEND